MPVMVLDRDLAARVLSQFEEDPHCRHREEVWDGVTYIMPYADNEHADITAFFVWVFRSVFDPSNGDRVQGPCNVSDRARGWEHNYRNPDASIFLAGNPARDLRTHWHGGPNLAVEIVSPDDRSRNKLDFYASVGTREVLILDRDPWQLELHRLRRGRMRLVGTTSPGDGTSLTSSAIPFRFDLVRSRPRPKVRIVHTETGQEWLG